MPIRKSTEEYPPRRSTEGYDDGYSRRRPSQDIAGRRSEDREYGSMGRRQSQATSVHSDSTSTTNAQSATAGMGMIIPNKSTIAEEEIEVPYARDNRDSTSTGTAVDERDRSRDQSRGNTDAEDIDSPQSPPGGLGGLSGLSARLQSVHNDDDNTGNKSEDYFDKMSFGRASVASDRSGGMGMGVAAGVAGVAAATRLGGRSSVAGEEGERIRREYEFKIATMQTRVTGLERDLEDAQLREQKWAESEERVRTMENELEELRQACFDQLFASHTFSCRTISSPRKGRRLLSSCKKSWKRSGKTATVRRNWPLNAQKKMRRSYNNCGSGVRGWKLRVVVE